MQFVSRNANTHPLTWAPFDTICIWWNGW